MKALLVSRFVRPERSHDLEKLLDALRRDGLDLGPLDAECKLLTPYAIGARYGAGLRLTEQNPPRRPRSGGANHLGGSRTIAHAAWLTALKPGFVQSPRASL